VRRANKTLQQTGALRFSFMSHWFCTIIGFGRRVLPAAYAAINQRGICRLTLTRLCAISVETKHPLFPPPLFHHGSGDHVFSLNIWMK
jgi:hypothetical protein